MDFIDPDGYGNCQTRDHRFPKSKYSCYVMEPSLCTDKIAAKVDFTKSISAQACSGTGNSNHY